MSAVFDQMTIGEFTKPDRVTESIRPTPYVLAKRPAVRVLGGVIGVLLSPVILALVVLVRITSPGPGLYRQRRVGLYGEEFVIYKIRSMRQDAEKLSGPVWAAKSDPRVTPIGRLLRYLHLDELPQVINVIRGEMDFVGPRPERPEIVEDLITQVDGYQDRHTVLPGITGLAQINLEPDQDIEGVKKKVAADRYYIENASFLYDLRLVTATMLRLIGLRYHHGARLLKVTLPRLQRANGVPLDRRLTVESDAPEAVSDETQAMAALCDTVVDQRREAVACELAPATAEGRLPR